MNFQVVLFSCGAVILCCFCGIFVYFSWSFMPLLSFGVIVCCVVFFCRVINRQVVQMVLDWFDVVEKKENIHLISILARSFDSSDDNEDVIQKLEILCKKVVQLRELGLGKMAVIREIWGVESNSPKYQRAELSYEAVIKAVSLGKQQKND